MSLKLQVPKRRHFELIGKGGATIKQLQQDYNVKIELPGRDEASNEVVITGNQGDLEKVHQEINAILGIKTSQDPLTTMNLDIPAQHHGALIGRGGNTLRDLEKKFGISISIPRNKDDINNYVVVEGAEKDLQLALDEIEALLKIKVIIAPSTKPNNLSPSSRKEPPPKHQPRSQPSTTSHQSASSPRQHSPLQQPADSYSASNSVWEKKIVIPDGIPLNKVIFFPDKDHAHRHNLETFLSYLGSAASTLDICVFTITDDRISNVILQVHKKGGNVRIITDNDTSVALGSDIQKFRDNGITVKMDVSPFHMHHKFAVIDKKLLINGSFNWTTSASSNNCENVMVTNNKDFVSEFSKHFDIMWNDTVNFQ